MISRKKVVQGVSNDSQKTYQLVNIATSLESIDKSLVEIRDLIDKPVNVVSIVNDEEDEEPSGLLGDLIYFTLMVILIIVVWVKL